MRQMHPASVCVVSVLGIALISHLRAQDSSPNTGKAPYPLSSPIAVAESAPDSQAGSAHVNRVPDSYGKLPISFEANQGQTDCRVSFLARGRGYSMYLTPSEVLLSLHRSHGGGMQKAGLQSPLQRRMDRGAKEKNLNWATVSMRLISSNLDARANGLDLLPGKANYLIGSDPRKWHTDVPTYARVRLTEVYPGVDLVYYGNQEGRLEHDFVVAPNADPNKIEFDLRDQDRTPAFTGGELSLSTKAGEVKLRAPLAYQMIGGQRRLVAAAYEDAGSGHIRFRLGSYDKEQPLVIDPVLVYSAVFGGSRNDGAQGIGIDSKRNLYVAGFTDSDPSFPLVDPFQSAVGGGSFVVKLNPSGTSLLYSTYLGDANDGVFSLSVDADGRAYIGGATLSSGIPIVNAAQPAFGGAEDGFITVLNPAGNAVEYSTFIGGPGSDILLATAVDAGGNLYATGFTGGPFPASHNFSGAQCSPTPSGACIWVAKYNRAGALQYSTLYAPEGGDLAIAADSEGSAYLTGVMYAESATLGPLATPGAYSSACNFSQYSGTCGFVAKLSPAGDRLVYSTTLGANTASGTAIRVDRYGNAYVGGTIAGPGFPVGSSAFQKTYGGGNLDGFVLKLNATGTALIWATYLGGSGDEYIWSLALDQYDQVYVSGSTTSPNFPLKAPIQKFVGPYNASDPTAQFFITTLSGSLSSVEYYSTYFGTAVPYSNSAPGPYLAVDSALNVYLAGSDVDTVQPTPGAYAVGASSLASSSKVFISKLTIMDDVAVALSATPAPVAHGSNLTYSIAVTSKGPDFGVNVRVSDPIPAGTTFVSYDAGGGTCSVATTGVDRALNCTLSQLDAGATWTVKLTVRVAASSGATLSDRATASSSMQDFVPANNSVAIKTKVD